MKLSNKYKNDISKYKLENNAIFKYFGEEISEIIFTTVPDVDTLNIKINNGEIEYYPNDKEVVFFQKQFIVLDKTNESLIDKKNFKLPEELNDKLGKMEDKVLDFIYDGGHRLLLTGKKGWGKTTFLRYVSRYVIPKLNEYKDLEGKLYNKPCIPIYISFNSEINKLNSAENKEYHSLFYNNLLSKIRDCFYYYISSDIKSKFYQFLLNQASYSDYRLKFDCIIGHHKKGWITSEVRDRKLDDLKTEISRLEETVLFSFTYCNDDLNSPAIPLIIFDDLDPLHVSVQTYIFTEIYNLAHTYRLKNIVSMRPRSYKIVSQKIAEALQINNHLAFSDSFEDKYLEGKFKRISEYIINMTPENEGIEIGGSYILKPLHIELFFDNFRCISLNKEVLCFLKNLSDGNLRKLNEFIKVYLKSGYIDVYKPTFVNLINNYIDPKVSSNIPIWIVYSAIFTNNYETVFGQATNQPNKFVVNILCNGTSSVNTFLIRLHLLSFFYRNGSTAFTFPNILERYKNILKSYSNEIKNDVARAIKRLNNYDLIGNNIILEIPDAKDTDKIYEQIDDSIGFYMEQLGRYYYETIISIFEYFYFMKDDIGFKEDTGILSCIETNTNIVQRFEQVIKYFKVLFEEEFLFYKELSIENKEYYVNNFAPAYGDGKILYVQVFVEKMCDYAKTRTYNGIDTISEKLIKLQNQINEEINNLG